MVLELQDRLEPRRLQLPCAAGALLLSPQLAKYWPEAVDEAEATLKPWRVCVSVSNTRKKRRYRVMSTATLVKRLALDEYLALERDAERRHEYLDGELVAMTGASRAHNLLATRIARLLGNHLEGSPCRVFQSDMKVQVERANRFYYPDVMVRCEPLGAEADDYYESAPRLIVEVLSPKTAAIDDGEKRVNYQTLESLEEYLLFDPNTHEAVIYRRSGAFWMRIGLVPGDEIELNSIDFRGDLVSFAGSP